MRSAPPKMRSEWVRVSRAVPCPICKKPDWCSIAGDGSVAYCMRIESDRLMRSGGWLHRLREIRCEGPQRRGPPVSLKLSPPKPRRYLSSESISKTWAGWADGTSDEQVQTLAESLCVTGEAVRLLGGCWAWPHGAWGFPMFDGNEEFAGIRLRAEDGNKWALRGSHQGIFIPDMEPPEEILVAEGPTDAAAAISLGLYAIGRPSCTGGAREITALCRRRGIKRVSVLADSDEPGIRGAREFCRRVSVQSRVVVLPAKDLREWLQNGATQEAVEACLAAHAWR